MIPKAELHVHIEGTVSPAMARTLAERHGVRMAEGLIGADGTYQWSGFPEFIATYDKVSVLVRTPEDYRDITADYLRRSAAQGGIYAELMMSPFHSAMVGISHDALVEAMVEGIRIAKAETGIDARLLAVIVRHEDPKHALSLAEYCAKNPHPYVTGLHIAGAEREDDIFTFADAFRIGREAGLGLAAHAGEACGPVSIRNTLAAVPGLTRIGHGVRAIEDADLVRELAERQIVLEVCPGSNIAIGIFPDFASHPLRKLKDAGVRVTLNSDDPPFFHTDLGREYDIAAQHFGFSEAEQIACTRTALEAAFVDEDTRKALLAKL